MGLILLILNLILAFVCSSIASSKGRSIAGWFCGGLFLGVLGLLIIGFLPNLNDEATWENKPIMQTFQTNIANMPPAIEKSDNKDTDAISKQFEEIARLNLKQFDPWCPIRFINAIILKQKSDGSIHCLLEFLNLSQQKIDAIKLSIQQYDSFSELIGTSIVTIPHDEIRDNGKLLGLKSPLCIDNRQTRKLEVIVNKIRFENSSGWEKGENEVVSIGLTDQELKLFRSVAGQDACCYAKANHQCWICVCGRENDLQLQSCLTCSRDKEQTLNRYSDQENIRKLLKIMEDQDFNPNLSIPQITALVNKLKEQGALKDTDHLSIQTEIKKLDTLERLYGIAIEPNKIELIDQIKQLVNQSQF